jgi:hypothetical protein
MYRHVPLIGVAVAFSLALKVIQSFSLLPILSSS